MRRWRRGPAPGDPELENGHAGVEVHRPAPAANAWPDDAVLLTYEELRRLIALHLAVICQGMPRDRPWEWVKARARAVEDGEVPLLLSEILQSSPGLPPG